MANLKTGWVKKLIDGVSTKIFAVSHVKSIYYNYASGKTLASKLDDMDTSIGSKLTAYTKTVKLPANDGWYRVATTGASIGNVSGLLNFICGGSGMHSIGTLVYDVSHHEPPSFMQLSYLSYTKGGSPASVSKARIVYPSDTYTSKYAYLEFYAPTSIAEVTLKLTAYGHSQGFILTDVVTGSIPSNYTSKEITFKPRTIVGASTLLDSSNYSSYVPMIYHGTGDPSASTGKNGDVYFKHS